MKVPSGVGGHQRDEAITWFRYVYPKTKDPSWPEKFKPVRKTGSAEKIECMAYTSAKI